MKVEIDTNIIFSCLLNTNNEFSKVIFFSDEKIKFYSCNYMIDEIANHWEKIKKYSHLTDKELQISYLKLFSKINFINENIIPSKIWHEAYEITSEVDEYDIDFVALSKYLNAKLWTSDKKLIRKINESNYIETINTNNLKSIMKI